MHRYLSLSGLQLIMVHLAKMLSWSCDKNRRKLWLPLKAKKKVRIRLHRCQAHSENQTH